MARWVEVLRALAHRSALLQRPYCGRNGKPFRAPPNARAPAGRTPLADRASAPHSSTASDTPTNPPRLDPRSMATTLRPGARCRPTPSPSAGRWHRARAPTPAGHNTDFSNTDLALPGVVGVRKTLEILTFGVLWKAKTLSAHAEFGVTPITALRLNGSARVRKGRLAQTRPVSGALPLIAGHQTAPVDGSDRTS